MSKQPDWLEAARSGTNSCLLRPPLTCIHVRRNPSCEYPTKQNTNIAEPWGNISTGHRLARRLGAGRGWGSSRGLHFHL